MKFFQNQRADATCKADITSDQLIDIFALIVQLYAVPTTHQRQATWISKVANCSAMKRTKIARLELKTVRVKARSLVIKSMNHGYILVSIA